MTSPEGTSSGSDVIQTWRTEVTWFFGGKLLTGREKGIAGSSNMADGRHVVWGGETAVRREKGSRAHPTWRTEVTWLGWETADR